MRQKRYVTQTEAAEIIGVSRPTVIKLVKSKMLPAVILGQKWRILREDAKALASTGWDWQDGRPF